MKNEQRVLLGLLAGNIVYALIICIIGAIFVDNSFSFILGVVLSASGSCISTVHMYISLQKSLDMEEDAAQKRETLQALIRMIIMIVVVATGLINSDIFHPLGVVFGAFALKASAYAQPYIHKYILQEKEG